MKHLEQFTPVKTPFYLGIVRFGIVMKILIIMILTVSGCNTQLNHRKETEICCVCCLLEGEPWYSNEELEVTDDISGVC